MTSVKKIFLVVIPALNEELSIGNVIKSVSEYADVLVVDDCSKDRTRKVSEAFSAKVISHPSNLGYDAALNTGYREAKKLNYDAILTFDADGQLPSEQIPIFFAAIDDETAVVCGDRVKMPRISEKIFAVFCKRKFNWPDPFCGMKAYNLSLCKNYENIDSYGSLGTELTARLIKQNQKIKNIEITVSKRNGVSRLGGRLKSEYKVAKAAIKTFSFLIT